MAERIVGTGWKMNHTRAQARAYAETLRTTEPPGGVQLFVLPPFTSLALVAETLAGSGVLVGAQNGHWAERGAWTGEISMAMIRDCGAAIVELGHSERRTHFAETDVLLNRKVHAALKAGLIALVCVGETAEEHGLGAAAATVERQVRMALAGLAASDAGRVWLAYEPVWAIGEGGTPATPQHVRRIHGRIREVAQDALGALPKVLYGGSVNADNARALAADPSVDGLFVGRAAWTADGLLQIARIAAEL